MADTEETPSQRQTRLRRDKREAKIKAGANERLDKITRLSGRTPESMRNESTTPISPPTPPTQPTSPSPNLTNAASSAQMQAQEEYLRQLLRTPQPQQAQGQERQGDETEDPMIKMMNQVLGSIGDSAGGEGGLPFSPDDISKATGLPSFVTDMLMGKQKEPPTAEQEKNARLWNVVHTIFALIASVYVVTIVGRSVDMFGAKAPAPATLQNPFLVFMMGELLVQSSKALSGGGGGKKGLWLWLQVLKDIARDGCVVVFVMGLASWWKGQGMS